MSHEYHATYCVAEWDQGRIEPPKVARGHATFIDGKMLSVTKQILTV